MDRRLAYALNALLFMPTVLLHGIIGAALWRWFLVPSGLPMLGAGAMCGVDLLFILFYPKSLPDREPLGAKREGLFLMREFFLKRVLLPLFILLIGFILFKLRMT